MRNLLIISMSLLAFAACNSNPDANKPAAQDNKVPTSIVSNPNTANGIDTVSAAMKPVISFKDTLHNFALVHEDEVVQYDFAFTNTGKSPLIISDAQASCGCTVPQYPHDPIAPGESAVMKVSFNSAGKFGHQEKSVSVHTNAIQGTVMLYIQADIAKKK